MNSWLYLTAHSVHHKDLSDARVYLWHDEKTAHETSLNEAAEVLSARDVKLILPMEMCSWLLTEPWPGRRRPSVQALAFSVEGDSAGGSAKQARDKEFQAILPLRGKILNTWEVDGSEVLASQEVHNIAVAIGVDPGAADMSQLRYGKICILADADSDGLHIATLLCALFVQHFRPLVDAGHVYVAMPPLYRIDLGKEIFYALDEAERDGILDRLVAEKKRGKPQVTRFKGLGEMNPPQLRETTMDPNTRRLVQLTLEDFAATSEMMDMLLAKKRAGDRKTWLESKGNLAQVLT